MRVCLLSVEGVHQRLSDRRDLLRVALHMTNHCCFGTLKLTLIQSILCCVMISCCYSRPRNLLPMYILLMLAMTSDCASYQSIFDCLVKAGPSEGNTSFMSCCWSVVCTDLDSFLWSFLATDRSLTSCSRPLSFILTKSRGGT